MLELARCLNSADNGTELCTMSCLHPRNTETPHPARQEHRGVWSSLPEHTHLPPARFISATCSLHSTAINFVLEVHELLIHLFCPLWGFHRPAPLLFQAGELSTMQLLLQKSFHNCDYACHPSLGLFQVNTPIRVADITCKDPGKRAGKGKQNHITSVPMPSYNLFLFEIFKLFFLPNVSFER